MRGALLALLVIAAACGARQDLPYHFRSPLLGSVAAPPLPEPEPEPETRRAETGTASPPRRPATGPGRRSTALATAAVAPAPVWRPPDRRSIPSEPLAVAAGGQELAARLRGLVGRRDERSSHLQLALAALGDLGARLDPELAAVEDGPALVALAERRGSLAPIAPGGPLPGLRLGDLLIFDRVVAADPASLVAVVVSVDDRGVVEFVYLARGVVRRGFVFTPEPSARRDPNGRVLNTFVRHSDGGDPRGTRQLAGDLLAAAISLDRLLR